MYQKWFTMTLVETTSRNFRENQKDFFELADSGKKVVIKRGKKQAYVLIPISEEDLYFSPKMIQRIKASEQEIKKGESTLINSKEELNVFFGSL